MPKFASGIPNSQLVKAKKDDPGVMLDQNGNYVVRKTDKLVFINYSWIFYRLKYLIKSVCYFNKKHKYLLQKLIKLTFFFKISFINNR